MRRSVLLAAATLPASVTLTGSAGAAPTEVACIGDSITAGVGASSPSKDWVSDLAVLLGPGVTVANFGYSGATMMKVSNLSYWTTGDLAMAEAFVSDAGGSANVAVIIMLGTNDSKDNDAGVNNWNSTAPARYAADYNSMIDALLALTPKPQVFLALPPPAFANTFSIDGTVIANQIIPIITNIATSRRLPVIDVHSALAGMSGLFPDGVHPNDTGHMLIATTMQGGLLSPRIPGADGGATDAATASDSSAPRDASAAPDAATATDASGPPPTDAGAGADADASSPTGDAGPPAAQGGSSGGCGCSTTPPDRGPFAAWWAAALTMLAAWRARRRRASATAAAPPARRSR
jgi:MYXO-CTERM domain-containing protein